MFGKKNYTVEPIAVNEDVLIQLSSPVEISKKTKISIPNQYKAIAFIDQKPQFRIEPCINKEFVKSYGKEYIGKQLKIAFISNRTLAQSAWGFGNIQVNNEGLKEAYRIGANGKFSIEITDYAKLIQVIPNENTITIDQVREKSISTIKTVGTPILGEYFSKTSTSVFEMSSLIGDFREKFIIALQSEDIFSNMGIKISTLTVDGFHANEDDLELIRNRINA
jgi:membrane protease subunit (stomatin/prohibitin family)